ncbi:hypothetical protein ACSSZE_15080 [Acidithiobacillus caldus]
MHLLESTSIKNKKLKAIEPMFKSWMKLNDRYNSNVEEDCTYFYGERSNCSILCAAAFNAGMVATMEVPIIRKKRRGEGVGRGTGRYDMYLCCKGVEYVFEMKQAWASIEVEEKLKIAEDQIRSIRKAYVNGVNKVALVFLAQGFHEQRYDDDALKKHVDELRKKNYDGVVHYYPVVTRNLHGGGKFSNKVYPGVSILMRVVD